mgnify:FL=1
MLQKKALRICAGVGYREHTDPLFVRFKCLKVGEINFLQTSLFMYRYNNSILPASFISMFLKNNAIHSYSTRQAANLHLFNPRTVLAHKSVRHTGPDVWNSLLIETRNLPTIYSFKNAVKRMLIANDFV